MFNQNFYLILIYLFLTSYLKSIFMRIIETNYFIVFLRLLSLRMLALTRQRISELYRSEVKHFQLKEIILQSLRCCNSFVGILLEHLKHEFLS